ncbi:MAG: PIG-L family deacetylase [Actinobacteria bacterium]|nr:PIG-L family deacetylase [Actinomycetota bacterium]
MRLDENLDISRAMVIYAHPDDAEFGAAGTVAKWAAEGVEVVYVLCTNGASGSSDPTMTRERLAEIRIVEQRAAADVLGVKDVIPLGFEDGYLYPTPELRKAVSREIRRFQPDVVITPHDPAIRAWETYYINHPDHVAVGEVVYRAINPDASSGLMFPELWRDEGLQPFLPHALFVSSFVQGTTYVDIGDTIERKLEALQCHESQISNPKEIDDFVRERARIVGEKGGFEYAEAFVVFRFDGGPVPREASGE